ncbi:hypothetical protein HDV00_009512 [Rhizophlyctis rosea]|nr:hypothetical protein HDV00_009512 [Rhizophlyctis rosea]
MSTHCANHFHPSSKPTKRPIPFPLPPYLGKNLIDEHDSHLQAIGNATNTTICVLASEDSDMDDDTTISIFWNFDGRPNFDVAESRLKVLLDSIRETQQQEVLMDETTMLDISMAQLPAPFNVKSIHTAKHQQSQSEKPPRRSPTLSLAERRERVIAKEEKGESCTEGETAERKGGTEQNSCSKSWNAREGDDSENVEE